MRMLLVFLCLICVLAACSGEPSYIKAPFDGKVCEIDASALKPDQPVFYSLSLDNKRITLFIVRVNGGVEAYFNACKECYPARKGFRPEGGHIKCRSCNERFPLESLQQGIGTCYPIPLAGDLKNGKFIITKAALMEGIKFF